LVVRPVALAEDAADAAPASVHTGEQAAGEPDNAIEQRMGAGDAQLGDAQLGDAPSPAVAETAPTDAAGDNPVAAELVDEAGYLRLNPDVRRAVEMGQIASGYAHYFWHGRAEGRALPDSPHEARNTMLLSPSDSGRLDVFPKEARCSLEALIISPKAGLMI